MPDGIVTGTNADDLIDATYTGDPEGDRVDNNDGTNGTAGDQDVVVGLGGNDTIVAGSEDDVVYGDSVAGTNLIVNGSFEDLSGLAPSTFGYVGTGGVTGWTTATAGVGVDIHGDSRGGVDPTDGDFWLDLEATPGNIRIGQDLSLIHI